jgi:hypothetical protein
MKIGFEERQVEHGRVHIRIHSWIGIGGSLIMENGDVVELAEIESSNRILGESTDPYVTF